MAVRASAVRRSNHEGGPPNGGRPQDERDKGTRRMPWLPEATKDAASGEIPRGSASAIRSGGVRMGQPARMTCAHPARGANAGN